jgi:hypothetical protein
LYAEWQAKIDAAQKMTTYAINGQIFQRIRYGEENCDWNAENFPCHDCGVLKGQYHVGPACDVEECPKCGGQVIACDCEYEGGKKPLKIISCR